MLSRALIVLAVLSVGGTGVMADEPLLTFDKAFDAGKVRTNGGAGVALIESDQGTALRVTTGHAAEWPGIELTPPAGRWDLSKATHLFVEVRNAGDHEVVVQCRVDNPGVVDGSTNCVTGQTKLAPGRSGTIKVELRRRRPEWIKVDLFGMRGYPWGNAVTADPKDPHAIDAANVVNLVIFVAKPTVDHVFEISGVRAVGLYKPPAEALKDPDKFFPFIDEFGQYIHADWPGKTHSTEALAKSRETEAKDLAAQVGPAAWDQYGGWKDGPTLKATGWFYAAKHEGKWWLVDPEGKLFFSHGMDCVNHGEGTTPIDERARWFKNLPGRDGEFKECYSVAGHVVNGHYQGKQPECFNFGRANLMRKYGQDWQAAFADISHRRLRSWGLNTIANWSDSKIYLQKKTPYTVNVGFGGKILQGSEGYWGKFRDVFDEDFGKQVRKAMAAQANTADDPWCIGYFVDNEISWGWDEVSLAVAALASPADQAAKKAFVADLKARYGRIEKLNEAWGTKHASWDALLADTRPPDAKKAHADLAAFHVRTAETYFKTVRDAVKEAAPNHLYLGCRFAWANTPAVAAAAKYCDVVSYNLYRKSVADFRLPVEADVPLIIGEFHFGALDRGMFHTGLVPVESQQERAAAYKEYVRSVLGHPQFVGCHWFKYMDEPTTGRPLDEENYQIGFLDIVDTPYPETIAASREIGSTLYGIRAGTQ